MVVPRRRIDLHLAIGITRHQHGDLTLQLDSFFSHASPLAQSFPRPSDLILNDSAGSKPNLSLSASIVTTRRTLAKTPAPQRSDRVAQFIERSHRTILPNREPVSPQPVLLLNPVLNYCKHSFARPHWRIATRGLHASR